MKKLELLCSCPIVYQGYFDEELEEDIYYENTLCMEIKNTGDEDIDFKQDVCQIISTMQQDDVDVPIELVASEKKEEITLHSEVSDYIFLKTTENDTLIWTIDCEQPTLVLAKQTSIMITFTNLYTSIYTHDHLAFVKLCIADSTALLEVYEKQQSEICIEKFQINGKSSCTVNYGEQVTMSWTSNADHCILYPYDQLVEGSGSMTYNMYEPCVFTLRAYRTNEHSVQAQVDVKLIDKVPSAQLYATPTSDKRCVEFRGDFIDTTYGYVDYGVGRIQTSKTMLNNVNEREFILRTLSKTQCVMTSAIVGECHPEILQLVYHARKQASGYTYQLHWYVVNCTGSIKLSKYTGATIEEVGNGKEGMITFEDTSEIVIPIRIDADQDFLHIMEIYPMVLA